MSGIIIAEDEQRIALFVDKGLRAAGFSTTVVADGASALEAARTGDYDLLLLDVGLPVVDGFAVLDTLRAEGIALPVIMLTARTTVEDTVAGLEGGANDYIPKPFRFDELLARVRLRLRDATSQVPTTLSRGDLTLDAITRRAIVGDYEVDLSAREFALAEEFVTHADEVLSREQLLSSVWGLDFDPGSNVVDVYVRYLRAKLGADRIETVRGMGYRMR
jgi:two-component system copper resistance phosphate regulon response regulator CusR